MFFQILHILHEHLITQAGNMDAMLQFTYNCAMFYSRYHITSNLARHEGYRCFLDSDFTQNPLHAPHAHWDMHMSLRVMSHEAVILISQGQHWYMSNNSIPAPHVTQHIHAITNLWQQINKILVHLPLEKPAAILVCPLSGTHSTHQHWPNDARTFPDGSSPGHNVRDGCQLNTPAVVINSHKEIPDFIGWNELVDHQKPIKI